MLKLNTESVVNHYKALAEAVDLPIVVQDYPPISGFAMEAGLLARIAREVPAARTIKLEDPPTPFKTARILAAAGDTKVAILGGLGGVFLLEELLAGAAGVMTGFAFPEVLVKVVSLYRAGKIDEAADVFYRFVPLMRFEFQEGIGMAIRKEVFRRRGALADGSTRAPGAVLDAGTRAALDRVLAGPQQQEGRGMDLGLKGKVAMVAGASRGLGYAVARGAGRRGRARVDRSRDAATRSTAAANALPRRPARRRSRRPWTCGRAIASTAWHRADDEKFGGVDLLFVNAGGPPAGTALSFDDDAWKGAFESAVLSAVRMVRLAAPSMKARGGGAIVVSTSSAVKEPIPNLALSNIVRASVSALSKTLANELAGDRIRVNHLLPGRIDTDRVRELDAIRGKANSTSPDEVKAAYSKTIPLGRYGQADEFAAAAVFLFSDAARYITGASLQVDGGLIRGV